jgi:hypothetical protein
MVLVPWYLTTFWSCTLKTRPSCCTCNFAVNRYRVHKWEGTLDSFTCIWLLMVWNSCKSSRVQQLEKVFWTLLPATAQSGRVLVCQPRVPLPGISGVKGGLVAKKSGSVVYQPHWLNAVELWGHNFLGHGKYVIVTHYYRACREVPDPGVSSVT